MEINKSELGTERTGKRRGRVFSKNQKLEGGKVSTSTTNDLRIELDGQFGALNFFFKSARVAQVIGVRLLDTSGTVLRRAIALIAGEGFVTGPQDGTIITDSDVIPYHGLFGIQTNLPSLGWSGSLGHPEDSPWDYVITVNSPEVVSDARKKTDVQDILYGLRQILALRPVSFKRITDPNGRTNLGFIAQETEAILPEAVKGSQATSYTMTYEAIIPVLVKAIQELTARVEELERKA